MRFEAKKNWMGPGWHAIDTETGRMVFEIAWIYDKANGEEGPNEERAQLFADVLNGKLHDEIAKLKSAIIQTLDDNAHLADGENCSLFALKVALRELGCPWDGDEKTS